MEKSNDLTFGDLDTLINKWTVDTIDMISVFENQSEELNKWFFVIGNYYEQLKKINNWLNVIKMYDQLLSEDICSITQQNMALETVMDEQELKTPNVEDLEKVQPSRVEIYSKLDVVYRKVNTIREVVKELSYGCVNWDKAYIEKNPFEQLAIIMMMHLEHLESIEVKLYQMMRIIQDIECKKHLVLNCVKQ